MITKQLLQLVATRSVLDLQKLADDMNTYFPEHDIIEPEQECAFIAQVAHETGGFRWLQELGGNSYFDKYEPGTNIGLKLGNTRIGDGAKFKGRGLIQLTGRYNYEKFGEWHLKNYGEAIAPEDVAKLPLALLSALWFWDKNKLKDIKDFRQLTKRINGGYNGYEDRLLKYTRLLSAYTGAPSNPSNGLIEDDPEIEVF